MSAAILLMLGRVLITSSLLYIGAGIYMYDI